ncbi:hypothetical protein L0244_28155 [bacterium]|nr:hypothetical protein [bacterium]MCI0616870.1 hypothetical protein [bacterium]
MRWLYSIIFFFSTVFYSGNSLAGISLKLVDAPEESFVYAPVRITGMIENIGTSTEIVDLTKSWNFERRQNNEYVPLSVDQQNYFDGDFAAVMEPGEKYFLSKDLRGENYKELQFAEEGIYEIRMVLSGTRQCRPKFLYKPHNLEHDASSKDEIYECWHGKIFSDPIKIMVWNARSLQDQDALNFVKSTIKLSDLHISDNKEALRLLTSEPKPSAYHFAKAYETLRELYPDSYYTFVAGMYAAIVSIGDDVLFLKQILALQPQHPLRKYALIMQGIQGIHMDFKFSRAISSELNTEMLEYLKQYKDEHDNWERTKIEEIMRPVIKQVKEEGKVFK